jgi:hydroxyacylglutathione hydrolase
VPAYFPKDAEINRQGAVPLDALPKPDALRPEQIDLDRDVILDVRPAASYGTAHVPGSINIALKGQFASWAGSLLSIDAPIVIVSEGHDEVSEAVMRLARVGIESVRGYLDGGVYAWDKAGLETATIEQIPVDELRDRIRETAQLQVLDVRRPGEYRDGHAVRAFNIPLTDLKKRINELDPDRPIAIVCRSGYRSSAATSILEGRGFPNVANVVGGTQAWISSGFEVEKAAVSTEPSGR